MSQLLYKYNPNDRNDYTTYDWPLHLSCSSKTHLNSTNTARHASIRKSLQV